MTYHWVYSTTGATGGAGHVYLSTAHELTPMF
jgi:hypothetical protein